MGNDRQHTTDLPTRAMSPGVVAVGVAAVAVAGLALFSKLAADRIETQVPADGQFVDVDGVRIHYRDVGEGKPGAPAIVMIHGLGGQMRNFSYSLLDELAGSHRVVLVDRPGSGYSGSTGATGANVRAQAAVMARFIAVLGLERPLVVGHSLGGAIALAIALNHPHIPGALALIAPLTQPVAKLPDAFKALALASVPLRRAVSWTLATPIGLLSRDKALEQVFAPEPVAEDFGTRGGGRLSLRPNSFYAASSDMVAANIDLAGMAARYGELRLPVAILYGRGDAILDPTLHGAPTAEAIAGAEVELVDGGHMLPVTQAELTARWIERQVTRAAAG